jgi:hypothetical protein
MALGSSFRTYIAKQDTVGGQTIGGYYVPNATEPKASVLSSEKGADLVTKSTQTYNKLTAPPPTLQNPDPKQPSTQKSSTFINPETDQTATINTDDRATAQGLSQQGYSFMEGDYPSYLDNPQLANAEAELRSAQNKLNNFSATMASDPVLSGMLSGISSQWDQRIEEMKRANTSRSAALKTTGIRLGSRYTGGDGGMFGSIITEEERQGVERIAKLEAEKQAALLAARSAYEGQKWDQYVKMVDQAEKNYERQLNAIKELQEAQAAQDKRIQDQKKLEYDQFTKPLNDIVNDAAKNGAPPEVLDAILSSPTLGDAFKNAGGYLQDITTGGVVGEYLFYKKQAEAMGQVPMDFNSYADMDANRKRPITQIAGEGGLNSKQTQNFLSITNKFQADPFINNALKGQTAMAIADQVIANPGKASNQLKSLYVLVKNLDPDSAVREGEVALAEKTQSYMQQYQSYLTRIDKGQVLSPAVAKELAIATKELASAWYDTAQRRQKQYKAQASGAGISGAFDEYLSASDLSFNKQLIDNENEAKSATLDWVRQNAQTNPQTATAVKNLYASGKSYMQIYEYLQAKGLIQ